MRLQPSDPHAIPGSLSHVGSHVYHLAAVQGSPRLSTGLAQLFLQETGQGIGHTQGSRFAGPLPGFRAPLLSHPHQGTASGSCSAPVSASRAAAPAACVVPAAAVPSPPGADSAGGASISIAAAACSAAACCSCAASGPCCPAAAAPGDAAAAALPPAAAVAPPPASGGSGSAPSGAGLAVGGSAVRPVPRAGAAPAACCCCSWDPGSGSVRNASSTNLLASSACTRTHREGGRAASE